MDQVDLIWKNGEFVPWEDAKVHVLSHALHYGTGVFEGIRAYETDRGPAVFRLPEHMDRLHKSAGLYYLEIPYSAEELRVATKELIARNGLASCYIRPLAFRGYGEMGLYANSAPVDVIIAVWPWGAYLGDESAGKGIRAKVSSWRRNSPGGAIPHAKASGSYLNSILAKTESANAGYDEAILLDERGFVSEGSGENIFVVREGEILTPPHTASILDGINRKSVIQIARDLGYTVIERDIARAELYLAEEVFLTGTAAEMVPVREIDDHPIGGPGEITRHIQAKFMDALHGRADEYLEWLDFVDVDGATGPTGENGSRRITPAA
ncbi:MAG TPA: branched-chain amino acid transaminase [Solirubrobacterales bacterium]|jgi:branched-chain amino acid aminotransferase